MNCDHFMPKNRSCHYIYWVIVHCRKLDFCKFFRASISCLEFLSFSLLYQNGATYSTCMVVPGNALARCPTSVTNGVASSLEMCTSYCMAPIKETSAFATISSYVILASCTTTAAGQTCQAFSYKVL